MAKTFEEWMADNQMTTGSGPNFVYGKPAYNQAQGSSGDRSTAILNWQREQGADYLSQLLGGGSGSASSSSSGGGGNPFGVPTMETGNRFEAGLSDAEARLKSLLDDPDSIKQTGAYKFRVKQGEDALQRQMGARGMLNSGNRLMELTKYGQDMGSQEYENQFGRLGNLLTNYTGGWIGDKNANTSRYSAEAGAWNQANASQNQLKAVALRELLGGGGGGSMGGSRTTSQMRSPYSGMTSYGMEFGGGVY
jgi:hypothetical protein